MPATRMPEHSPPAISIDYDHAPTLFVVGNSVAGRSRAVTAGTTAGFRVLAHSSLGAALDAPISASTLFVEVDDLEPWDPEELCTLLERINARLAAGPLAAIVSTPAALIDLVAAAAPALTQQLADATDADRIAALAQAAAPVASGVREAPGGNAELIRLARLTEEVARVAAALARSSPDRADGPPLRASEPGIAASVGADEIRRLIRARRLRAQYFGSELFADPAWDMLLDLAAAHAARTRVAVSSLCIAAAVPPTTALRWIRTLTDAGLFVRTADPADGRRVFIELSDAAAVSMQAYLSARGRLA